MWIVELLVVLFFIWLGARLGSIGIGFAGGFGVLVLVLVFGIKPGSIPVDVILIIMSVIAAIAAMQVAGGLDFMVHLAEKVLRSNPKYITFIAPVVTYTMTMFAGTGLTAFSTLPVIAEVAKETGMVVVAPMYEEDSQASGMYYNTAAVIDADGSYLGKYRKTHIPQVKGFWEKFYFRPGNLGYPVFDTAVGKVGVYICYDRHFPEGWRALALNGAEYIVNPSATVAGLSKYLWELEQPASAAANGVFIGAINRVGTEEPWATTMNMGEFYGSSYIVNPRGAIEAQASYDKDELLVHEIDLDMVREVRDQWQFFRDRRPETYWPLTED